MCTSDSILLLMKYYHLSQLPVLIQTKHFSVDQDHSFSCILFNWKHKIHSFLFFDSVLSCLQKECSPLSSQICILHFLKWLLFIKYLAFFKKKNRILISLFYWVLCLLAVNSPWYPGWLPSSSSLVLVL